MRIVRGTQKAAPKRIAQPVLSTLKPSHRAPEQALSLSLYADLLSKPFVAGGRTLGQFDCVGLVLILADRLGKQLPEYVSTETELHAQLGSGASTLADLPQIPEAVPGCVVLLRISPAEHHVAFMVDSARMIHTTEATGCVVERINSALWLRKIVGFYSLAALPEVPK